MIVVQENSAALNRYSNIARFQVSGVNDPQPMPPLPLLHDAVPVVDGSAQVRAERLELVDGTAYAQSWWCRPS